MSLNPARLSSLGDKLDEFERSAREKEEEKIKASKKPSPKKLTKDK